MGSCCSFPSRPLQSSAPSGCCSSSNLPPIVIVQPLNMVTGEITQVAVNRKWRNVNAGAMFTVFGVTPFSYGFTWYWMIWGCPVVICIDVWVIATILLLYLKYYLGNISFIANESRQAGMLCHGCLLWDMLGHTFGPHTVHIHPLCF